MKCLLVNEEFRLGIFKSSIEEKGKVVVGFGFVDLLFNKYLLFV